MNISHEDITRLGSELKQIVTAQSLSLAVAILKEQYFTEFTQTEAKDRDKREQCWQKSQAIDDLVSTLNSMAIQAEQELERRENENYTE